MHAPTRLAVAIATALFAAVAHAQGTAPAAAAPAGATAPAVKAALAGEVVTITARIEAVDQATRMVTLRGPEGRVVTMKAGPEVKNLAQVKAGDELVIRHAEAVALKLRKGSPGRSKTVTTLPPQGAPAGAKPAFTTAQETTIVANVESVDVPAKRVVLQGPEGRYLPLRVKYTSMIRNVKPGDSVEATFIEALVVEVVGPKQ